MHVSLPSKKDNLSSIIQTFVTQTTALKAQLHSERLLRKNAEKKIIELQRQLDDMRDYNKSLAEFDDKF
jgi:hypothetical protein